MKKVGSGNWIRPVKRRPIDKGTHYEIPLACGAMAKIDRKDLRLASKTNWFIGGKYPTTIIASKRVTLHRLLFKNTKPGECVDHVNSDPLDNRRANLRICTLQENGRNRKITSHKRTKGTHFLRTTPHVPKPWQAHIRISKKLIYLGSFATEQEAATVYDVAARKHFGRFARFNEGGAR